jgi:hypothetical protein
MNLARFIAPNSSHGFAICLFCFILLMGLSALMAFRAGDAQTVQVGQLDLGEVVTGPKGPEAGV